MKALLVIDMLNDFVREDGALPVPDAMKLVPGINAQIDRFHENGWSVIFICDSHDEDDLEFKIWPKHSVLGTKGAEVVPELHKSKEDPIVNKKRYSA
ncbi:MAG: cysteine hydrolase family protein, partial [Candidatus Hydrothermarchaeales archaeon]